MTGRHKLFGKGIAALPPSVIIPIVQPAVGYNGTQLSGGTPPADPVRTLGYGKPAMAWLYGFRGMTVAGDDELMGIEAEAVGGMAYIDVWVEGTTQRLHRSKQNVYSPRTGQLEDRVAYWFYLRFSTGQRGAGYKARLFAKGVPNDPTMQERVIGWYDGQHGTNIIPADTAVTGYRTPVDVGELNAQMPMWVFPRANKFDATKHVKADGTADYTTLRAALTDCATAINDVWPAYVSWDIVLHDADNEGGTPTSLSGLYGGDGGIPATRIRAAQGVVARVFHNSTWDKYNTPTVVSGSTFHAWDWEPFVSNLWLYGGADGTAPDGTQHGRLVLDTANFKRVLTRGQWGTICINGALITNSTMVGAGDMFHLYQNGIVARFDGFQYINDPSNIALSLIDQDQEFATIGYGAIQEYRCNRVNGFANPHDNAHPVVEGYICGYDGTYEIANKPALRISYTGSGANANYRISQPGGANADALVELLVGGSVVASVSLVHPDYYHDPDIGTASSGTSVFTMTQLATWIDAQANFGCVEPPSSLATIWAAHTVNEGNYGYGTYTSADIKAATIATGYLTAVSWRDSHNEAMHWLNLYFGGPPQGFENALMLRCIEVQSHWSTGHLNIEVTDDASHNNLGRDIIVASCLAYSTNHSWGYLNGGLTNDGNGNGINISGDHVALINCSFPDNVAGYLDTLPYHRTGVFNSVIDLNAQGSFGTPWSSSSDMNMVNTAHKTSVQTPPASPLWGVGDWIWTTVAQALFRSVNDFRPDPAGQMASHKVAYDADLWAYDVMGQLFDETSDFIGAFAGASLNFTPPLATYSDATYPITA